MTQHATGALVPAYHAVLREVAGERQNQDEKWGEQNHPNGTGPAFLSRANEARDHTDLAAKLGMLTFGDILLEEVYEAMAEEDPQRLREELIQVAAVAVAWVESIDRAA